MAPRRDKLLIVDGYNVLRSGERYRDLDEEDFTDDWYNAAREALINDVIVYVGADTRAIIVFDGAGNPHSTGGEVAYGPVTVIFSPANVSADYVIERLCHQAKLEDVETRVVTSDAVVQDTVAGGFVTRLSASGFSREMAETLRDARLDELPEVSQKNTVAERIDAATLARLVSLRDRT